MNVCLARKEAKLLANGMETFSYKPAKSVGNYPSAKTA